MDNDTILDSELTLHKRDKHHIVIRWWEQKRITYNVILVAIEVFMMLNYWEGTIYFGLMNAIIYSTLFTIVANCIYSIGWGVEMQLQYYVPSTKFSDGTRKFLWGLGVLFSIWLTYSMYFVALAFLG